MKVFLVLIFFSLVVDPHPLSASTRKLANIRRCLTLLHADKISRSKEISGEEKWPLDGYDHNITDSYNNFFAELLRPFGTFEKFAAFRKNSNLSNHLLDLASSGVFSSHPEVFNTITGFRVAPLSRDHVMGPTGLHNDHEEFLGNAYAPADWKRLDETMQLRDIPAFDIIIVRSVGGTLSVRTSAVEMGPSSYGNLNALFKRVIERAWLRLAPKGDMFIEIPVGIESQKAYKHWLQRLISAGISAETQEEGLHLHKYSMSEIELPD